MSKHARERRRPETGQDEAEHPPAPRADDPRRAGLLALQRSAGNQAVQRLMYIQQGQTLKVPKAYADQRIPFVKGLLEDRAVKPDDPKFIDVANQGPATRAQIATGIDVSGVSAVASTDPTVLGQEAAALADPSAQPGTGPALTAAATATDRLLTHAGQGTSYFDATDLDVKLVLQARDFFAEAPDLPASGFGVRQQIPKAMKGQQLWNLVCVLIALVKANGYGQVETITGTKPKSLDEAVQLLHNYYTAPQRNVQYDDTSSRFKVMNQWGYKLIYSGKTTWENLPTLIALNQGQYIFDIVGHTMMVDVLQNIAPPGPAIATHNLKQYFTPQSDKDNYKKDELKQDVQYIWAR